MSIQDRYTFVKVAIALLWLQYLTVFGGVLMTSFVLPQNLLVMTIL